MENIEAGKPEKSLEECKCEISEKYGYKDQFHYEAFHDGNFPHDEAAELYASQFQAVIAERDRELKELKGKVIEYQEKVNQTMDNQVALIMQRDTTIEAQKKEIEEYEKEIANLEKSIFQLTLSNSLKL